jgi:hypothetical protein
MNDRRLEGDETVILSLSYPTENAFLGEPAGAVLNIHDDGRDVIAGYVDENRKVDLYDVRYCFKSLAVRSNNWTFLMAVTSMKMVKLGKKTAFIILQIISMDIFGA